MAHDEQQIVDAGDLKKYRHEIPNMADEELDPYQYRLYGHYKRRGRCFESIRETAKATRMSPPMVIKTRNWLRDHGWITVEEQENSDTLLVTVVDRWQENFTRFSGHQVERGGHVVEQGDHQVESGDHQVESKKEPIKKEHIKKVSPSGDKPKGKPQPKPRPRDTYFDAICRVCDLDPDHLPPDTKGSAVGKVKKNLKAANWQASDVERYHIWRESKELGPLKSIHWLVDEMAKKEWRATQAGAATSTVSDWI